MHTLLDRCLVLIVEQVRLDVALRDRDANFGLVPAQDKGRGPRVVERRLGVDRGPPSGTKPRRRCETGLLFR